MFAGAAFTDQADIKVDSEVVDTLVALGVVNGYDDGSFKPNGTVTRAEMAKMIYVLRTGNSDASAYNDDKTSFTDIGSHWARGYIKYCQSLGIIAGKSNTKFCPNDKVTAQEAAKMLLVTLGYDAAKAGLTGANWASKTNALADENGLLEDVNTSFTAACPRQYAAQLIYNAIDTPTVVWRDDAYTNVTLLGNDNKTVGEKYMSLQKWIGTFKGDDKIAGGNEGQITVKGSIDGQHKTSTWTGTVGGDAAQFKANFSNDFVGEEVSVLFKDGSTGTKNQPDDKDVIFGIYVTDNTSVVNAIADDIDDDYNTTGKVSVDDKAYKVAETGSIISNYDTTHQESPWANKAAGVAAIEGLSAKTGDTVKFILNENNEITTVYVVNYHITKVTAVNSNKVSLKNVASIDIDDNDIYDGVKKDDVVVYTKLYDNNNSDATFVVTKAEAVTGKLTGYKDTEKVTVDGKVYSTMNKTLASGLTDDAKTTFTSGDINDNATLYMVNGFVGCVDMPDSASNYAYVESVGTGTVGGADEFKMKVILADGSEKLVTVDEDGTVHTETAFGNGDLIKYSSISDSNEMEVSSVVKKAYNGQNAKDLLTATAANNVYDKDLKSFATNAAVSTYAVTTSDAVLFVKVAVSGSSDKYYAYNIRSLGNIKAVANSTKFYAYTNNDGKVEAAFVQLTSKPSGSTADTVYGIVSEANGTVKVGDEYKSAYKVVNNVGEYPVYMPTGASVKKGDIVSFDVASDNIYSNADVTVYTATDAKYIDELDKDNVLSYYDCVGGIKTTKALDDDAQIVYVNQDKDKAGDDIGVNEYDSIDKYANAVVVLNNSGKVDAIIVESSGECDVINGSGVIVGAQSAEGTTAANETATYAVTAKGYAAGTAVTVAVKDSAGHAVANATGSATNLDADGKTTVTITEGATAIAAGTYTVELTINQKVVATFNFVTK